MIDAAIHLIAPGTGDRRLTMHHTFAQLPVTGDFIGTGPNGPWYRVVMVMHLVSDGATTPVEVMAIRIDHDRFQHILEQQALNLA